MQTLCHLFFYLEGLWHLSLIRGDSMAVDDRAKKFACSHCECSFSMLTNLRRHVKKVHPIAGTSSPVKSVECISNSKLLRLPGMYNYKC